MTNARLVLHRFRFDLIEVVQNSQSRFFTLALPALMLVILVEILGSHQRLEGTSAGIPTLTTYYVPSMIAFGIVWASLINLAVNVTVARERGVLKRQRAAPIPPWVVIVSRSLTALLVSVVVVLALVMLGAVAYGVDVPTAKLPGLAIGVAVGSMSFCALGYALVGFISSEDAALPVILGVALPLYFISGIFIEYAAIPDFLHEVAELFPVQHLAAAVTLPFDGKSAGAAVSGADLLVVGAWGLAGLAVASRRFSWEPRAV